MKKIISLFALLILFSLTGCNKSETEANTNTESSSTESAKTDNLALGDYLKSKDTSKIWYTTSSRNFGKDSEIDEIYVFKDGKVAIFSGKLFSNLGELSKLTDKEILSTLEEKQISYTTKLFNDRIQKTKDVLTQAETQGDSDFKTLITEYQNKALQELTNFKVEKIKYYPYQLSITTDGSGNRTSIETITFKKRNIKFPSWLQFIDSPDIPEIKTMLEEEDYKLIDKVNEDTLTLSSIDITANQSYTIYDSDYKAIEYGSRSIICNRINDPSISIYPDGPGSKGVKIDEE